MLFSPPVSAIHSQTATLSARLRDLFPPAALAAELRGAGDVTTLLPAEAPYVARAVAKRQQEFAAGRECSRLLLAQFGIVDFALRMADDRRPLWPDALVGSITHTEHFCSVVVAERTRLSAVGIDSEISGSVKPALWESICTEAERAWLDTLEVSQQAAAATLIFSAKEAFYKLQYPLMRQKLHFQDAMVEAEWGSQRGSFTVHAPSALAARRAGGVQGRYLFHEQFVTTGIALA
jgi:4'-phosphopantetheinyl transferase EntD